MLLRLTKLVLGGERNANKTDKNSPELHVEYFIYLKMSYLDLYMHLKKPFVE